MTYEVSLSSYSAFEVLLVDYTFSIRKQIHEEITNLSKQFVET